MLRVNTLSPPSPSTLVVPPREAVQRRAAAELVRPAEVAGVAAALAPWVYGGTPEGDAIAGWLRNLRYLADPHHPDVWQSPLATLMRGGGDCEDLSIAALSVLLALGGDGVLVVGTYYSQRGIIGHAWLEGHDSVSWFHLDATNSRMTRGARPAEYVPHALYGTAPRVARGTSSGPARGRRPRRIG